MERRTFAVVGTMVAALVAVPLVAGAFTESEKEVINRLRARIVALETWKVAAEGRLAALEGQDLALQESIAGLTLITSDNDEAIAADIETLIANQESLNANDAMMDAGLKDLVSETGPLAQLNQMVLDLDARMDEFDPPIALTDINPIVTCSATSCTVSVEWNSDPPATGQVEWGETETYGNLTTKEESLLPYHRQFVGTFPADGKTYHFRIIATTPGEEVSALGTFDA